MSEGSIDIKIAVDGQENKDLYKTIDINIESHQEKLNKLAQEMTTILSKNIIPFFIVEYPIIHSEHSQLFSSQHLELNILKTNSKIYQFGGYKSKESVKLVKNVEKEFQKISKLNNNCNFKISLYDLAGQENCEGKLSLLNRMKIKAAFKTDPEFITTLIQIIRRLSIDFLNSPLMALLQALDSLNLKLDLGPIEQSLELQQMLKGLDMSQFINKQTLKQLQSTKGQLQIHLTLPKLFSINIKAQASIFSKCLSIFLPS